jgi:hypothetical protein
MPYIIYSTQTGPIAYVDDSILNVHPRDGEIAIPCEPGADVNDVERWRLDADYMEEYGTIAPTLELAKEVKAAEITAERKKAVENGKCTVVTRVGTIEFWTGAAAVSTLGHYVQEVALSMLGEQDAAEVTRHWKAASGYVDLPGDAAIQAGKAIADWTQQQFDREADLSAAVEAAETIEDVQAITWDVV